ncbi:paraquat-inducible protein A [Vibrio sp. S4M6]|uniref:paraquat-inducible protein A n=1 Tax=Vibrio sinus TaxID=2946865 RepID=UPI002029EF1C|nr:paraquat-inducible protein A [Vibrio sinus]MCL9779826.1 paraquat-inducible protein A [Vibrio sinus]
MKRSTFIENETACESCDWVNPIPPMQENERLRCSRCKHVILSIHANSAKQLLANSSAALMLFFLSLTYEFLGFTSNGISQQISLLDCINALLIEHFTVLGAVVSITLIILPIIYLVSVLLLSLALLTKTKNERAARWLLLSIRSIEPWLMVDVFLLGGLVALVKLTSLAQVSLGISFWAFTAYTILLLRTVCYVDKRWLWNQLFGASAALDPVSGSARSQDLIGCQFCGALNHQTDHMCSRCHHVIASRKTSSLHRTLALLISASILYVPANFFPIMNTTFLGTIEHSTIIGGVMLLWALKSYPVALVILIASVLVPIAKILSLFWLCWQYHFNTDLPAIKKQKIYHLTELVGRWSMVDIFVVAILSALVQLGSVMNIVPGLAALSFCAVVIITMLAAMSFDSRLIWDKSEE